jgi:NADH dehydrogenase
MKFAVTGAFGYSGKYIARRLIAEGREVITLTGNLSRPDPFGGRVKAFPFRFSEPARMAETLQGVDVLVNTYWVRFDHGDQTHSRAVQNTNALLQAAKMAEVRRLVHISITNPDKHSPLPYFRGKALLEQMVINSGLGYAILRPTVIFGKEDILINNIVWLLRRFPFFLIPGDGAYRLQPIFVDDFSQLVVNFAQDANNVVIDAIGPETFTFRQLVRILRDSIGVRTKLMHVPAGFALAAARSLGIFLGDELLTKDELKGLMANLLYTQSDPVGRTPLSEWTVGNSKILGTHYASELSRHYADKKRISN